MFKNLSSTEKIILTTFGLGLFSVACCTLGLVVYLVIKPLLNTPARLDHAPAPIPEATTISEPSPTSAPSPTAESSPTPEPPISSPPAPEPGSYKLLIAANGEDSLFVVNQTAEAFPLELFRLENEQGAIDGRDWAIEMLESGACVTVWKNGGKPEPPPVICTEVGKHLTREGRGIFWKKDFKVYYQHELIDTCPQKSRECIITIQP